MVSWMAIPHCKNTVEGRTRSPILTQQLSKHLAPSQGVVGTGDRQPPHPATVSLSSDTCCSSALPAHPSVVSEFLPGPTPCSHQEDWSGSPLKVLYNPNHSMIPLCVPHWVCDLQNTQVVWSHPNFPPSSRLKFSCWPQEMALFQCIPALPSLKHLHRASSSSGHSSSSTAEPSRKKA